MTISSSLRRAGPYNGNDSATAFPFEFKVFVKSDVLVTLTDTAGFESTLVLDSDYTVTLSSDQDSQPGGTVNYPVSGPPLPEGYKLTLSGNLPYSQPTDIQNSGGFYPQVVEDALDRLTIQTQQLAEEMTRTVKVDVSDPTSPDDLFASVLARANASAEAAAESDQHATAAAQASAAGAASAGESADAAEQARQQAEDALKEMAVYVSVVPAGNISSSNVQDALYELDQKKVSKADVALLKWATRGIGEYAEIASHMDGAEIPPTDNPNFRYIKLTAADAYNTGVLISESVSGTAPNISASAVISLADSPMDGQTVRLANTERRYFRPGSPGTLEESQNMAHTHSGPGAWVNNSATTSTPGQTSTGLLSNTTTGRQTGIESSGGSEVRVRSMGVDVYQRIL